MIGPEVIDISKPINIEEIRLSHNELPSSNFGPGIELLMNENKKSSGQNIELTDLNELEDELNNLSNVNEKETFKLFEPTTINFSKPEISKSDDDDFVKPSLHTTFNVPEKEDKWSYWKGEEENVPKSYRTSFNEDKEEPSMSASETLREKFKLLNKFEELRKKGVEISKHYSLESSLEEMKSEYECIISEKERSNSIKFQGKMLMAIITGVEFLNNRFDPFDLKLDGWAEQLNENIEDYDDIFSELHEKYKSKAKMAPELKLLFQLAGSGIMLHMTNTMFKSAIPGMDDIMRQNPALMQQFTQAAMSSMGASNPNFAGFMNEAMASKQHSRKPDPPRRQEPPRTERPQEKRPDMKGPSDLADILGGLKSKTINLNEPDDVGSTVSLSELKEMKEGLAPRKVKKRNKSDRSDRNVMNINLDM
jgi:hypothetical protein